MTRPHPEAGELELLQEHADDDDGDLEMPVFKGELRWTNSYPGQLPGPDRARSRCEAGVEVFAWFQRKAGEG